VFFAVPPDLCLFCCVFYILGYDKWEDNKMSRLRDKVRRFGGEISDTMEPRVSVVISDDYRRPVVDQALKEGKRVVTMAWLNDVLSIKRKVVPPWEAVHVPPHYRLEVDKPCKEISLAVTGFIGAERDKIKLMIQCIGAKYTGVFSKSDFALICKK
jgi:PAX-interacting protein 1